MKTSKGPLSGCQLQNGRQIDDRQIYLKQKILYLNTICHLKVNFIDIYLKCIISIWKLLSVVNYCKSSVVALSLVREILGIRKIQCQYKYTVILIIGLGNIEDPTLEVIFFFFIFKHLYFKKFYYKGFQTSSKLGQETLSASFFIS